MFDIGWTEMLVIAVVAIVVIGPKELPRALRTAGQMMSRVRGLARDFQRHVDDMVRESELDDLRKKASAIQNFDTDSLLGDDDPTGGKPAASKPADPAAPDAAAAEPARIAPAHSLGAEHGAGTGTATASAPAAAEAPVGEPPVSEPKEAATAATSRG